MLPEAVAALVLAKVPVAAAGAAKALAEAAVPAAEAVKAPAVEAALEKANKLLHLTGAGRRFWKLARRFFQANVVSGTKGTNTMRRNGWTMLAAIAACIFSAATYLMIGATPAAADNSYWGANYFPNVPLITQEGKTFHFYNDMLK